MSRNQSRELTFGRVGTPRIQQAWELAPRATDTRIPAAPVGTRFVKVLPTAVWAAPHDEAELARFTVSL